MRASKAKAPSVWLGSGSSLAAPTWYDLGSFTYADFSAAALTSAVIARNLPAHAVLYGVRVVPTTAFVLPGASFYNLRLGILGTTDLYLPDYDVLGLAPGNGVFGLGTVANGHISSLAGWALYVTATADVNLDGASAGAFDLAAQYAIVP